MRQWALWKLPCRARRYVLVVDALAAGCIVALALRTSWRAGDALTAVAFVACGVASLEVFRHIGAPHRRVDRPSQDLIAAFLFPVALLLPPVYAALAPLPFHVLLQIRVTRQPLVKRVHNAAAAVLICVGAAVTHDAFAVPLAHAHRSQEFTTARALAGLFLAAMMYLALNKALVVGIIRRVAPATPWRTLLWDAEAWTLAVADVSAGMVLTLVWLASPVLIGFALIPILLLQRAVVHTHLVAATRHDPKTGLANPSWWRQEAGRAVTRAQHGGDALAVVVIDLDRFKTVNDRHGHLLGDAVLAAVADTLRVVVRPGDLVGRFGGDEFTVLLNGTDEAQAMATGARLCDRLAAAIRQALPSDRGPVVTASLGVAVFGPAGITLEQLLAAADAAMYEAKASGGNCLRLATKVSSPAPGQSQLI